MLTLEDDNCVTFTLKQKAPDIAFEIIDDIYRIEMTRV